MSWVDDALMRFVITVVLLSSGAGLFSGLLMWSRARRELSETAGISLGPCTTYTLSADVPEATRPRLLGLRLRVWDLLDPYRAATLRWRACNAAKPRVCECGAPGVVRVADGGPVMGSCVPYWWRCAEHQHVSLMVPWLNGVPLHQQPYPACSWRRRNLSTGRVEECGCGKHVGIVTFGRTPTI